MRWGLPQSPKWQSQGCPQPCRAHGSIAVPIWPSVSEAQWESGRGGLLVVKRPEGSLWVGRKQAGEGRQGRGGGGGWVCGWEPGVVFIHLPKKDVSLCLYCRCRIGFCPGSRWPRVGSALCHRPAWPGNLLQEGIWPPHPRNSADWPAPVAAPGDPVGTSSSRGTGNPSGCSAGFQPVREVPGPTWGFAPPSLCRRLKHTSRPG